MPLSHGRGSRAPGMAAECPACGADQWRLRLLAPDTVHRTLPRFYRVSRCEVCGLGRTEFDDSPAPAPESIYPTDYAFHTSLRRPRRSGSERTARRWAALQGNLEYWRWCDPDFADLGTVGPLRGHGLDVGCGSGRYLARFRDLGWSFSGIESSSAAADQARSAGFEVENAPAEAATYPVGTLDLVTMYHSLEHCVRPEEVVRRSIAALVPGGVLAIALCNFDSPGLRFFGPAWPPLELPRHRYHFGPGSIRRLLERAGARVVRISFLEDLYPLPTALVEMVRLRAKGPERQRPLVPGSPSARLHPGSVSARALGLTYALPLRAMGASLRPAFLVEATRT